jgi:ketosteroid isomerase-like protein
MADGVHLHREADMRFLCLLLFVTAMLSSLSSAAFAQDNEESAAVSKIVALEKAWNQAFKSRDLKAIDSLLDDRAVLVNDDGSLQSKGVFLAMVRDSKPSDEQQVTPESISVRFFGGVGIATGVFRSKGVEGGKPYVRRNRFVDMWLNRNGAWVCVSASATPLLH